MGFPRGFVPVLRADGGKMGGLGKGQNVKKLYAGGIWLFSYLISFDKS